MATSLLVAWKLNHLSEVPKCHCQCAPVVQVVVDDEGRVVEAGEQVRHGGGARLVAPAEGQPVQRRVKEVPRLGQRALSLGVDVILYIYTLHHSIYTLIVQIININMYLLIYIEFCTNGICDDSFIL